MISLVGLSRERRLVLQEGLARPSVGGPLRIDTSWDQKRTTAVNLPLSLTEVTFICQPEGLVSA